MRARGIQPRQGRLPHAQFRSRELLDLLVDVGGILHASWRPRRRSSSADLLAFGLQRCSSRDKSDQQARADAIGSFGQFVLGELRRQELGQVRLWLRRAGRTGARHRQPAGSPRASSVAVAKLLDHQRLALDDRGGIARAWAGPGAAGSAAPRSQRDRQPPARSRIAGLRRSKGVLGATRSSDRRAAMPASSTKERRTLTESQRGAAVRVAKLCNRLSRRARL